LPVALTPALSQRERELKALKSQTKLSTKGSTNPLSLRERARVRENPQHQTELNDQRGTPC
jgi:hypothetical protein